MVTHGVGGRVGTCRERVDRGIAREAARVTKRTMPQ
jgi:hypothetical protein